MSVYLGEFLSFLNIHLMELNREPGEKYFWSKLWGKKFLIFSAFLIILTTIGVIFLDQTDNSDFNPLNIQTPHQADTVKIDPSK